MNPSLAQLYFEEGIFCQENGDETLAFSWFVKAKDLGSIDALINLGICYELGKGTSKTQKWHLSAFKSC
ncbi:MAG: sel1 repeat family protein [Parachlamydiaceae bacterium]|nr:MAG: sel1 repeat family protein [Parachlamydiaceae bacterium]